MNEKSPLSAREKALLERTEDPERREVIACALFAHRRPDRLAPGDPAPDLRLERLDGGPAVGLRDYQGDRPLLLAFGSYT